MAGVARSGRSPGPLRVLLLSAPVGDGHVAAARALAARMRRAWPDASVDEVEDAAGGPWRTRLLAASYGLVMRRAPGLYGLAYDTLARFPAVSAFFQRRGAPATARALAGTLARHDPDLVVSTYPVTSGGLDHLRRTGRLAAHTVAVVTDAAVHPFWVWAGVDETWTMLPATRDRAREIAPAATVRVVPPAVDARFVPAPAPAGPFTVLVTGGSLGFGSLEPLADAVLAAGARATVLCGRHERLRARLAARRDPRLRAVGWTDDVVGECRAAHLVLSTGGGMLALEALAVGRPVLFATPVPGHGRAGAAVMADAGLALVAPHTPDVTVLVRELREDPARRAGLQERVAASRFAAGGDLDAHLGGLRARLGQAAGAEPQRRCTPSPESDERNHHSDTAIPTATTDHDPAVDTTR